MRIIVLLGIILFHFVSIQAQSGLIFHQLNVNDGLSQNSVLAIAQDKLGFMWFGTRYGLNRYDAKEFRVYESNAADAASLSSSEFIQALYTDRENRLWAGTQNGLNLYVTETEEFVRFLAEKKPGSINSNFINCIYQDASNNIWVGTNRGLNLLEDIKTRRFRSSFKSEEGQLTFDGQNVTTLFQDSKGSLWMGTGKGLFRARYAGGQLAAVYVPLSQNAGDTVQIITSLVEGPGQNLWIGTKKNGLYSLNLNTLQVTHFVHALSDPSSIIGNSIRKMVIDQQNKLWIGTQTGLSVLDVFTGKAVSYEHDPDNPYSLSQNSIYDLFIDQQGSVWIGTYFGGVNVVNAYPPAFEVWQSDKHKNSLSSNIISSLIEDRKGNLWIGTEASGINVFSRESGRFTYYRNEPNKPGSLRSNLVKWMYEDRGGQIWVATYSGGLEQFDPATNTFKHYVHGNNQPHSVSSDNVSCLLEDNQGRFWVGTEYGLNILDRQTGKFTVQAGMEALFINYIFEDSRGNIWVSTSRGVMKLDKGATHFQMFDRFKDPKSRMFRVNTIYEDASGNIWFGVFHGGLVKYTPGVDKSQLFTISDGLPSNNVLEILEEHEGVLWISCDKGLTRFEPGIGRLNTYDIHDGLPGIEFNKNSKLKDRQGKLYFGAYNGLVSFNPREILYNSSGSQVVFTGLKVFNQPVRTHNESPILKQPIAFTKMITLAHDQNVFSISYALLNYVKMGKNRSAYYLEGVEKNWNYTDNFSATYSGLPPGTYTLWVKGANNDGVWSSGPVKMIIRILPPLWKTYWAYLIYMLIIALIAWYIYKFFHERAVLERDMYQRQLQHKRENELHQMKLDFFTDVSHELRTPLTLMLAPLDRLLEETKELPAINSTLGKIRKNGGRLLKLLSELLDYRKIESGKMKLKISNQDFTGFCAGIFEVFEHVAIARQIKYDFVSNGEPLFLYFDRQQLEKVFFNILANAFRFVTDGGHIQFIVTSGADTVTVRITDNGKGIAAGDLQKVFDRFYQGNNKESFTGSGIGLTVAKEIIELHNGAIKVNSGNIPQGTEFIIDLPITGPVPTNAELTGVYNEDSKLGWIYEADPEPSSDYRETIPLADTPTLLIVEDNKELNALLCESLQNRYNIIRAFNGEEGLNAACENIPDIIISDVLMPVKDGLELCSDIKSDERTNHIPVILLTAKDAPQHFEAGYKFGADVYITKPFSTKLLELQIYNLLKLKEALQKKYRGQLALSAKAAAPESFDDQFLARVIQIVETNIDNADFNIAKLSAEIGMSQAVFYKKFKALTDMAPADFIKSQRFKIAAELLKSGKYTVADVCYAVGYDDRKYFSREFRKIFGVPPSVYMNNGEVK